MGLLDDAIRDHLDLKRRHGADPAEVDRAEREALGPVRRGPEEPEDLPLEPVTAEHEDLEHPGDEERESHEPSDGDDGDSSEFPRDPDASEEKSVPVHETGPDEHEEQVPTEEHEPAQADAAEHHGEETAEFNVDLEDDPGEPHKQAKDDVLEETPEFLQDTPDHDRLWFEQRPPRDFDFDG